MLKVLISRFQSNCCLYYIWLDFGCIQMKGLLYIYIHTKQNSWNKQSQGHHHLKTISLLHSDPCASICILSWIRWRHQKHWILPTEDKSSDDKRRGSQILPVAAHVTNAWLCSPPEHTGGLSGSKQDSHSSVCLRKNWNFPKNRKYWTRVWNLFWKRHKDKERSRSKTKLLALLPNYIVFIKSHIVSN